MNDITGRGGANIRRQDDSALDNGRYTATLTLGQAVLDSESVTLACLP